MRRLALFVSLALGLTFSVQAKSQQCHFESDYKFSQQGRTLVFSREASPGKRILIQDGRMVIDGKEMNLASEDKARVSEFENEIRLLIPQVKYVTGEAIDIAFTAMIEVSRALNGEQNNQTVVKLQNAQLNLRRSLHTNPTLIINDDIDEKIIEPIVTDFVPDVVGAAVKQALSLAFSGDEEKARAFEKRMDNMGKEIETKVKVRAKKLEPLADAMCDRMRHIDKIESGLNVRLDNKQKINLLETSAP